MAEIRRFPFIRHLRAETTSHVLGYRNGELKRSGTGLAFWFLPMGSAVAEVPVDDRDVQFAFHARTADYQEVTIQGVMTYRVAGPEELARRIDFAIDLFSGRHLKQPLEQLHVLLTGVAQRMAMTQVGRLRLHELLTTGLEDLQGTVETALLSDGSVEAMGIRVVAARVLDVRPTAEMEKALQTPTREALQQQADEAVFQRRALAVDKERAIAENELANRIELARREEELIQQEGQNRRQAVTEQAEAARIEVEAKAERTRLEGQADAETATTLAKATAQCTRVEGAADAEALRAIEGARAEAEAVRMDAYREMPPAVVAGLAAQELANKLQTVEHLNITPDLLAPLVARLVDAGARRLDDGA